MQRAARTSKPPGASGDLRRRLLRHHMPLALASAAVLLLFMGLPRFDANVYPHADLFSGAFPQQRERGGGARMADAGGQGEHGQRGTEQRGGGPTDQHGGSQTQERNGGQGEEHGGGQREQHGGGQAEQRGPGQPEDHGGGGTGQDGGGMQSLSFLGLSDRGFTVATGYLALALLAVTLLIGPANLLLRRRNPVSGYLRRDVGAWTALFSVVHVIYGLQVHERLSDFLNYFVTPRGSPLTNSFGLGNWTGLAATVIVVGLLALSSDAALRKLKAKNWKRLQRLNYALFALVILHAFFYGALVRTDSPYTLLLLLSVIAVVVGQAVGVGLYRRRYVRRRAEPSRAI
jgi:methionine sulfoxide reductase heme-binding subunit